MSQDSERSKTVNPEEKFGLIEDWLARPMDDEEREIARKMLEEPANPFAGSNSPGYIAHKLDMRRKAGKKTKTTEEVNNGSGPDNQSKNDPDRTSKV